jgi:hypothetical protein
MTMIAGSYEQRFAADRGQDVSDLNFKKVQRIRRNGGYPGENDPFFFVPALALCAHTWYIF